MFKAELKSDSDEDICILVKVDNHSYNYICECGEAKRLSVKECQNTNAIFLSHTHIDHFVNFDTILRHQIGIKRKVVICGPKGIITQVQNRIRSYCWNLIEEDAISYEVREIEKQGRIKSVMLTPPLWEQKEEKDITDSTIFEEKEFYVEFETLNHKTDSIAYAFKAHDKTKIELPPDFKGGKWVADLKKAYEKNDGDALIDSNGKEYLAKDLFHMIKTEKGELLGIIMDHAASAENHQKIKNKFFGFDTIFIECFYKDEDKEFAEKNYHSYASMSGKIVKECQVKNAIPVHFSRKYDDVQLHELILEFERAKKNK